jgi:hypothetical protein
MWAKEKTFPTEKNVSSRKWGWGKYVFGGKGGHEERMGLGKGCGLGRRHFLRKRCVPKETRLGKRCLSRRSGPK